MQLILSFGRWLWSLRPNVNAEARAIVQVWRELNSDCEKQIKRQGEQIESLEARQAETDKRLTACMEHHRECDEHRHQQQLEILELQLKLREA